MRTTTAGELAVLASLTRAVTLRLMVQNGSGTMIDLTQWLESISTDDDIDRPIAGLDFNFRRDDGTTKSLSPLRTDSTLNRLDDGVTYSPALDLNRIVTFESATTIVGASIVAGDFKMLFKGTIDVINFENSPVSITCRDLGAPLVDRFVETEAVYGTFAGRAIELVKQDILDASFGAGVVPLFTPVSPGFNIVTYQQQKQCISDAEQALDQLIGWDSRYWWDAASSTYKYTLQNPPRTKTTPDYTFGPQGYFAVTALNLDLTDIRNVVQVSYLDSATNTRLVVTRTDATSIAKYGRRFFFIQEADTSPIDTSAEATTMADAALSDLKEPKATLEIELPFFWPCQLWDLYRFSANGVHFNSDQDLAVSSFQHKFSKGKHRTIVKLRGKPAGGYALWLQRGGSIGQRSVPPSPVIRHNAVLESDDTTWSLVFDCFPGSGGGGTNLTYTISSKVSNFAESALSSGSGSAFPLNFPIVRDSKYDTDIRFTVTDAATGLIGETHVNVPVQAKFFHPDGSFHGSAVLSPQGSINPTALDSPILSYVSGGPATNQMYLSWTWSSFTIPFPDGSTITVPSSASLATPPSPTLSQVVSGALAARTRFVRIGYVKNNMVYHVGAESPGFAISVNNLLKVTSPAAVAGYDGYTPLVGSASNAEFQQGIPLVVPFGTDWTEPGGGATVTGSTPYNNTDQPNAVTAVALLTSSTYKFYPFWDIDAGVLTFSDAPQTTPTKAQAAKQVADRHTALSSGAVNGLTPAAGVPGSGAGGGGKFL